MVGIAPRSAGARRAPRLRQRGAYEPLASTAREKVARLEQRCAERGLKMTGQRRTIIRALSQGADHPDAEELYRRALLLDRNISIATVYRTVRLFEDRGILQRRDFGNGRARYESTESGSHYHLIDIETGKVAEFRDVELERQVQALAERQGFEVISLRLEAFGKRLKATPAPKRLAKQGRKKAETR